MTWRTLVEDLAVVLLTILLPTFSSLSARHFASLSVMIGKAALILLPVTVVATKLIPPLLARVARSGNNELFLLVTLAIGLATAALTQAVGLSLALGAFLAGMVISGSNYAHETLSRLLPVRDVFVALFFVTMGALINPRLLLSAPSLLAVLIGLIVLGKFVIWTGIMRLFRYPTHIAALAAVGLTQIGEFSYILVQVARNAKVLSDAVYNATLMASLVTILVNAALVHAVGGRVTRRRRPTSPPSAREHSR